MKLVSIFGVSYIISTVSRYSPCNLLSTNYRGDHSVRENMSLKISPMGHSALRFSACTHFSRLATSSPFRASKGKGQIFASYQFQEKTQSPVQVRVQDRIIQRDTVPASSNTSQLQTIGWTLGTPNKYPNTGTQRKRQGHKST